MLGRIPTTCVILRSSHQVRAALLPGHLMFSMN